MSKKTKPMSSFYPFYQVYYGKESRLSLKQRKNFGMAISATENVISQAFVSRSETPIINYLNKEYKYALTAKFLENFLTISYTYERFYQNFIRGQNKLVVETPGCYYDKISIRFHYLYDVGSDRFIIISYGESNNIGTDFGIMKVMCNFYAEKSLPSSTKSFEYWNLSDGSIQEISANNIKEVKINSLQPVIYRLAS
ncbi:hypothetical protein [Calidifontibacillus oryziterrae]|uniref:hypothetical protein n=1 Tax=Calidifontibacillus oryziterrae TaxID=1191699 RepID=UPI0002DC6A24|nr:hypothetical protein [Calidifontibacillus oryziterrae]